MRDERIKQLMAQTPMPESLSVYTAMKQLQLEMEIENATLREALVRIKDHIQGLHPIGIHTQSYAWKLADEALKTAGGGG